MWSIVLGVLPHNATNKFIKKGKNKKNREVFKDLVADVEKNTNGFGTDLLPSLSSIGKRLEWAKKLRNLLPQDPKSWDDFPKEIPVNLTKTAQVEDFVLIYCMTPAGRRSWGSHLLPCWMSCQHLRFGMVTECTALSITSSSVISTLS